MAVRKPVRSSTWNRRHPERAVQKPARSRVRRVSDQPYETESTSPVASASIDGQVRAVRRGSHVTNPSKPSNLRASPHPSSARVEPVAHPRLGDEVARVRRIRLELLPQLPHEHAKVLRLLLRGLAPYRLEKRGVGEDPVRVAGHVHKEIELFRRQPHLTAVSVN